MEWAGNKATLFATLGDGGPNLTIQPSLGESYIFEVTVRRTSTMTLIPYCAKRAREVVFSVLRDAMVEGDISITKAVVAVKEIFSENAKKLYKLHKLDDSSKDSDEPHISSPFIKEELHGSVKNSSTESDVEPHVSSSFQNEELNGSSKDVTLVRLIWIDASGQHRC
ncbi:hypothetical protein EJD97_013093, partial [Solanum chilense]